MDYLSIILTPHNINTFKGTILKLLMSEKHHPKPISSYAQNLLYFRKISRLTAGGHAAEGLFDNSNISANRSNFRYTHTCTQLQVRNQGIRSFLRKKSVHSPLNPRYTEHSRNFPTAYQVFRMFTGGKIKYLEAKNLFICCSLLRCDEIHFTNLY